MSNYIYDTTEETVQAAIEQVTGDNINDEMAENILNNYVVAEHILVKRGLSDEAAESSAVAQLVELFTPLKDELNLYIEEMYADEVGL